MKPVTPFPLFDAQMQGAGYLLEVAHQGSAVGLDNVTTELLARSAQHAEGDTCLVDVSSDITVHGGSPV